MKIINHYAHRSTNKEWLLWHVAGVSGRSLSQAGELSGNLTVKKSYEDIHWQNIPSDSHIMIMIYKRKSQTPLEEATKRYGYRSQE